jgi:hypothetical protein
MAGAGAGQIGLYDRCSFRLAGTGTFRPRIGAAPAVGIVGDETRILEERIEMVVPDGLVDRVVAALVAAHPYEEPAYDVYDRRGDAGFVGRVGTWHGGFDALVDRVESLGGATRVAGASTVSDPTVAVVPGSGGSLLEEAAGAGAHVVVTGDVKHHQARAALDRGVAVIDPGHAATERPGTASLYAAVSAEVDDAVDFTGIDADPWRVPPQE